MNINSLLLVIVLSVLGNLATVESSRGRANVTKIVGYPKKAATSDCNQRGGATAAKPPSSSYPVSLPRNSAASSNKKGHASLPLFKILNRRHFKNSDARNAKPIISHTPKKSANRKKFADLKRALDKTRQKSKQKSEEKLPHKTQDKLKLTPPSSKLPHVKKASSLVGQKPRRGANLNTTTQSILKYMNRLEKLLKKLRTVKPNK